MFFLYTLVGNLISKQYDLVSWYFTEDRGISYSYPIPTLALAERLKKQREKFKIVFLVPHSVFIKHKNTIESLSDPEVLKKFFKDDLVNYFTSRFEFLTARINQAVLKEDFERGTRNLLNFLKKIEEIDINIISDLERFKELEEDTRLRDLKNFFKEEWLQPYKEKIEEVLKEKNKYLSELVKNARIEIFPSAGAYISKSLGRINYNLDPSQRILTAFLMFAKDIIEHPEESINFVLDVSTGLNTLVVEITEAFNNASILSKILSFGNQTKHNFLILSAEPVIGTEEEAEKGFSLERVEKKAFLSKPVRLEELKEHVSLIEENGMLNKGTVKELVSNTKFGIFIFNTLYFNTPLCITLPSYETVDLELKSSKEVYEFLKKLVKEFYKKWILKPTKNNEGYTFSYKLRRTQIPYTQKDIFKVVRDLIYTVAFGFNIMKNLETLRIIPEEKYLKLSSIRKFFDLYEDIYGIPLNSVFLEREIDIMERYSESLEEGEEKSLIELKEGKEPSGRLSGNWERHFIAHCGFLENVTLISKKFGETYLRYLEDEEVIKNLYTKIIEL